MATNQGSVMATISGTPHFQRSAGSQGACSQPLPCRRSMIASVIPASSGTIGAIGPLRRMPTPRAAQNAAARRAENCPGRR